MNKSFKELENERKKEEVLVALEELKNLSKAKDESWSIERCRLSILGELSANKHNVSKCDDLHNEYSDAVKDTADRMLRLGSRQVTKYHLMGEKMKDRVITHAQKSNQGYMITDDKTKVREYSHLEKIEKTKEVVVYQHCPRCMRKMARDKARMEELLNKKQERIGFLDKMKMRSRECSRENSLSPCCCSSRERTPSPPLTTHKRICSAFDQVASNSKYKLETYQHNLKTARKPSPTHKVPISTRPPSISPTAHSHHTSTALPHPQLSNPVSLRTSMHSSTPSNHVKIAEVGRVYRWDGGEKSEQGEARSAERGLEWVEVGASQRGRVNSQRVTELAGLAQPSTARPTVDSLGGLRQLLTVKCMQMESRNFGRSQANNSILGNRTAGGVTERAQSKAILESLERKEQANLPRHMSERFHVEAPASITDRVSLESPGASPVKSPVMAPHRIQSIESLVDKLVQAKERSISKDKEKNPSKRANFRSSLATSFSGIKNKLKDHYQHPQDSKEHSLEKTYELNDSISKQLTNSVISENLSKTNHNHVSHERDRPVHQSPTNYPKLKQAAFNAVKNDYLRQAFFDPTLVPIAESEQVIPVESEERMQTPERRGNTYVDRVKKDKDTDYNTQARAPAAPAPSPPAFERKDSYRKNTPKKVTIVDDRADRDGGELIKKISSSSSSNGNPAAAVENSSSKVESYREVKEGSVISLNGGSKKGNEGIIRSGGSKGYATMANSNMSQKGEQKEWQHKSESMDELIENELIQNHAVATQVINTSYPTTKFDREENREVISTHAVQTNHPTVVSMHDAQSGTIPIQVRESIQPMTTFIKSNYTDIVTSQTPIMHPISHAAPITPAPSHFIIKDQQPPMISHQHLIPLSTPLGPSSLSLVTTSLPQHPHPSHPLSFPPQPLHPRTTEYTLSSHPLPPVSSSLTLHPASITSSLPAHSTPSPTPFCHMHFNPSSQPNRPDVLTLTAFAESTQVKTFPSPPLNTSNSPCTHTVRETVRSLRPVENTKDLLIKGLPPGAKVGVTF